MPAIEAAVIAQGPAGPIVCGDQLEYEIEFAKSGKPQEERCDWPYPSFKADDWAAAFCKVANNLGYKDPNGKPVDEGWMIGWFANSLMRGFDEGTRQAALARAKPPETGHSGL